MADDAHSTPSAYNQALADLAAAADLQRLFTAESLAALDHTIERLIALRDAVDGDPDLEEQWDREKVCEDEGSERADGVPNYLCHHDQTQPQMLPWRGVY